MTRSVYTGVCLVAAIGVAAPATAQSRWSGGKSSRAKTVTAIGCLEGGAQSDSFVLNVFEKTEAIPAGSRVALTAPDESEAQGHVGQMVEVLGTMVRPRRSDVGSSAGRIVVRDIRQVAPQCGATAPAPQTMGAPVGSGRTSSATARAATAPVASASAAAAPAAPSVSAPSGVTSAPGAPAGVATAATTNQSGTLAQTGVSGNAVVGSSGSSLAAASATTVAPPPPGAPEEAIAPATKSTAAPVTTQVQTAMTTQAVPATAAATTAQAAPATTPTSPLTTQSMTATGVSTTATATQAPVTTTQVPVTSNPAPAATDTVPVTTTEGPAATQTMNTTNTQTGVLEQTGISGDALLGGLVSVNVQQVLAAVQAQANVPVQAEVIVNLSDIANDLQVQALVQALNTNPQASMNANDLTSALQSAGMIDPNEFVVGVTGSEIYSNTDLTTKLQQRGIISPSETVMSTLPGRIYVARP